MIGAALFGYGNSSRDAEVRHRTETMRAGLAEISLHYGIRDDAAERLYIEHLVDGERIPANPNGSTGKYVNRLAATAIMELRLAIRYQESRGRVGPLEIRLNAWEDLPEIEGTHEVTTPYGRFVEVPVEQPGRKNRTELSKEHELRAYENIRLAQELLDHRRVA